MTDTPAELRDGRQTIYQELYRPKSLLLRRPAPSPLRTGRDHRRAHMRFTQRRRRFEEPMLSVHQRPFAPADRSEPGHWEGDVIVGPQHRTAIGTLVERHSRFVRLIHLPRPDSFELRDALLRELAGLPPEVLKSITWDQGSEMARHLDITAATGAKVYFCDAGSPWQRGSKENTNGLLRQYFQRAPICRDTLVLIWHGSNLTQRPTTSHPQRPNTSRYLHTVANL